MSGCNDSNIIVHSDTDNQKEPSVLTNTQEPVSVLPHQEDGRENRVTIEDQDDCSLNGVFSRVNAHSSQNQLSTIIASTCPIK